MKGEILCHRKTGRMSSLKTICRITGIGTIPLMSSRIVITDRTRMTDRAAKAPEIPRSREMPRTGIRKTGLTTTISDFKMCRALMH